MPNDIPHIFPTAVLKEAEAAQPLTLKGREDWRSLPLVTIDPFDAKDHDDAVYAESDPSPDNEGGFIITVAIADVAAYVSPHSVLDSEALIRGNSVYFPDQVVPMLPEHISNDLCSLKPKVERPALAVQMIIDAGGRKKSHHFHRIMMKSAAKLSYEQAQALFNGSPDEDTGPLLERVLKPLFEAYTCASLARDERAPLYLDLPERKIILNKAGEVDRVLVPERLEAHKLIEEFMIMANVAAAETLESLGSPLLYRAHDEPSVEKMRNLGEVLASIGLKLPKAGALQAALFNRILKAVEGGEHQAFVNEIVLRSQAQAEYTAENYGHFGLNLRKYAHFTSPIRRYADVIVHRALIAALKLGKDGLPKDTTHAQLKEIGEQISNAERRAMAAERDTVDRLIAHHLAAHIGSTFNGRIAGVTRSGLFVKLDTTGADGFIPAATLGADYYAYDEARHALIGSRTGETYRLGDRVEVKLIAAAPIAGALTFEMLTEGKGGKAKGSFGKGNNPKGKSTSGFARREGSAPKYGKAGHKGKGKKR
jgi:ribonuclease R